MTTLETDNTKKRFISIRIKLVFAFISVGIIIVVTVVSLAYFNARQALEAAAFAELELLRETRGNQLLLWFNERRRDVKALSHNPLVIEAMQEFSNSLPHIPESAQAEYLQTLAQLYRNQPETVNAADDSVYTQIHARFHPFFREYLETYGYKDLYLVTPNGDIVYSVDKQADFGTNLIQGPFSHGDAAGPISRPYTNISTVFHQVLQVNDPQQTIFRDFENYPASDRPSTFLGSGIFDGDELIGVLILQLPIDIMGTVLNQYAGLGQTGETYVVGSDLLFRNDSRFLEELGTDSTILNEDFVVETRAVVAGRVGISGTGIIENYQGQSVLSGWRPIVMQEPIPNVDDFGIIWVLIAEINTAEALAPANRLLISSLGAGLLVGILILLIAYVVSNRIARPIQQLTDTAKLITQGDLTQQAHINTNDETGVLAQAFNLMTRQLGQFIDTLEQRVVDRTERLEMIAVVGERLTSILNLETLLVEIVNQVKENFNYYHVHIYLLDAEREKLVVAAGTGETGKEMVAQGHNIAVAAPTSLVARAARRREIVHVDDVRQASDWLPNAFLPDTHSEMAVPIIAEDEVIGVLDVQSDKVAGLDKGDMDLLRSLANQLAVALTNAQLYQAEAERAQELAKLNTDLKAAQDELLRQERLATLGKLTATVAHEIRNPLGTVQNSVYSIRAAIERGQLNRVEPALQRSERNITRCDNIITELLDYTRMHELELQPLYLDEWLQRVLAEQTIPEGITLSVDLVKGVEILLDPERFRRVIVNLVDNACQAMQETSRPDQPEQILRIQSEIVDSRLKISISDTGPGIPPEVMPHIFEPLYSTKSFGVGLGLPVVEGVIQQHGGKIEINSEVGTGTQVTVWLPLE
jgi:signal transduction histidine kinase